MALISVAQPSSSNQPKESTFDQVIKGLQVAGSLINVGTGVADAFARHTQATTGEREQNLKEQQFKLAVNDAYRKPTGPDDPDMSKALNIGSDTSPDYLIPRDKTISHEKAIPLVNNGVASFLNETQVNERAAQLGKSPTALGIVPTDAKGVYVDFTQGNGNPNLAKTWAEINKLNAEAAAKGKESEDKLSLSQQKFTELIAGDTMAKGRISKQYMQIDRADALVKLAEKYAPDLDILHMNHEQLAKAFNSMPNFNATEFAKGLDVIISAGYAPTVEGTTNLNPDTFGAELAAFKQKITGVPQGQEKGQILSDLFDTVKRERSLAYTKLDHSVGTLVAGFSDLVKARPENVKEIVRNALASDLGEDPSVENTFNKLGIDLGKQKSMQNRGGLSNAITPTLPKPGSVEDGHLFKGGNPADPNSWEKIK